MKRNKSNDHLFNGMSDKESIQFQLDNWIEGRSYHNPIRDECCPDFSCCDPSIHTNQELKNKFKQSVVDNNELDQWNILSMFLCGIAIDFNDIVVIDHNHGNLQ